MQTIQTYLINFLPQLEQLGIALLKAALILIVGYYFSQFIGNKVRKAIAKKDEILAKFIAQVIFVLSLVVMIVAALGTIGVQTNSIIAVLGTAVGLLGMLKVLIFLQQFYSLTMANSQLSLIAIWQQQILSIQPLTNSGVLNLSLV